MLDFPLVPPWWISGVKFQKLMKNFNHPKNIIGYDTETYKGTIMTQQMVHTSYGRAERNTKIEWVTEENVLENFLNYLEQFDGFNVCYCFNAKFDLTILMRQYIDKFLLDEFTIKHKTAKGRTWEIRVCCSRNWHAFFIRDNKFLYFLDIQNFFSGSLNKVATAFQCNSKKLPKPDDLGEKLFYQNDKSFVAYAIEDAILCLEIGEKLLLMHEEFDIPVATSSANFAEKVFRRKFFTVGQRIQFPQNFPCMRLAELTYHGGKNGYYMESPVYANSCYEYDFNSAYPYSMCSLPSFVAGSYVKTAHFTSKHVGVYEAIGIIKPCKYGILYNTSFDYFRFTENVKVRSFCTGFELQEAIESGEFKLESAKGYIWKPDTLDNPLKDYNEYFWEKKNSTSKKDIKYIFYKLLLNSLYGKWIQRNPVERASYQHTNGQLNLLPRQEKAGGLYHPFIASLITGHTRARLHNAEHYYNAIESSTDSVKSQNFDRKSAKVKIMGSMELQDIHCDTCDTDHTKFKGLFARNRLNLLMCPKEHILKCALHGFWGKPNVLLDMYKKKEYVYQVERMPLIREGIKQIGKGLFQMNNEERSINVSWDDVKILR